MISHIWNNSHLSNLSHSLTHTHSLACSYSHTRLLIHLLADTDTHSLSRSPTHSLTGSLTYTLAYSLTRALSLVHSFTDTHSLVRSHTHWHTHTFSLTHSNSPLTDSMTYPFSPSLPRHPLSHRHTPPSSPQISVIFSHRDGALENMEVSEEKQDARPTSLWKLPRRKKIILGSLISGSFLSYTCLSLLGPFYPGEVTALTPYEWWSHQTETCSALLAFCAENSPVTGEFPAQRPVTRSVDVFYDPRLNHRMSKQWRRRWFETPSYSLWHHCNGASMLQLIIPVNRQFLQAYNKNNIKQSFALLALREGIHWWQGEYHKKLRAGGGETVSMSSSHHDRA